MDYTATYPTSIAIDERVKEFISTFYAISDHASRNDEWVDCFMPDAVLAIGEKRVKGIDEIRELRKGMWETVKSRKHSLEKVFPAAFESFRSESGQQFEYMLYGSVDYELKSAEKTAAQWAARAVLVNHEGKLKYVFYQIYIHP
ncbi:hypothetical protein ONZ43_g3064 [Nemania bipapillata]|uniref:Uncharacterized protein n=1 Tax=Nemania bipapillata TaxID=110536 RepID=A0ACC2IYE2_9PEZI|nr:hypothetical protein ONZ43_g3064 [Nemania bipapillata]